MINRLVEDYPEFVENLSKDSEFKISFDNIVPNLVVTSSGKDQDKFSDQDSDVEVYYGESYQQILDFINPDVQKSIH